MSSITRCIACGGDDQRPLYEVNGFAIVKCPCGLARTVLPDGFDPAAIYDEGYFQGGHRDGYADYSASGEDLKHEFRRILAAVQRHVDGGRLVELGCAYGFFLDEARGAAFDTLGVELSAHARAVSQQRGLEVVRELTPELAAARGPFDAAVMLDVLEHMRDPGEALDQLHAAMRPGAQLVLTTGDFGSPLARLMGSRWRLMTPPQHLWFFDRRTVTALLARHGFRVHEIEHPWKHVPLALVAYQATRYLGGQTLVRRFVPAGRIPINLFDAMRVIAERVDPATTSEAQRARYELAARHAHGRVLDLACGQGDGTRALADRGTAVTETLGVDASQVAIEHASRHHARDGVSFTRADASTFTDDAGFDTVISLDRLGLEADPEAVVVRMLAALRPGGVVVATTHTCDLPEPSFRMMFERYGLRDIERLEEPAPRRPDHSTRTGPSRHVTIVWQRASQG